MRTPSIGVLFFPGTNCHTETVAALELCGAKAPLVYHQQILSGDVDILDFDGIWIPGGFAWGDYWKAGRVAGIIMRDHLLKFVATGRPVAGICNGDQTLFEAGLFDSPENTGGALVQNECGHFVSRDVNIIVEDTGTPWTRGIEHLEFNVPVAHGQGRWRTPPDGAPHLKVAFRYVKNGHPTQEFPFNPSGSPHGVAGIVYDNVMGMMPHPERVARPELGYAPGLHVIRNFVRYAAA